MLELGANHVSPLGGGAGWAAASGWFSLWWCGGARAGKGLAGSDEVDSACGE